MLRGNCDRSYPVDQGLAFSLSQSQLRFNALDGAWRVAFAFDRKRQAIILVAGDKSRVSQKRFYKRLIQIADQRFTNHLNTKLETKDGNPTKEQNS